MTPDKKQERIVLAGLLVMFVLVGAMLAAVSIFGGGLAGE